MFVFATNRSSLRRWNFAIEMHSLPNSRAVKGIIQWFVLLILPFVCQSSNFGVVALKQGSSPKCMGENCEACLPDLGIICLQHIIDT